LEIGYEGQLASIRRVFHPAYKEYIPVQVSQVSYPDYINKIILNENKIMTLYFHNCALFYFFYFWQLWHAQDLIFIKIWWDYCRSYVFQSYIYIFFLLFSNFCILWWLQQGNLSPFRLTREI